MNASEETLQFATSAEGDQGCFIEPDTARWRYLEERLDEVTSNADGDIKTYADYLGALREIISLQPDFLDAYAHLGRVHLPPHPLEDTKTAARWYRKGLKVAQRLIPDDFQGKIDGRSFPNRPFFRLHHGLILCTLRQEKFKQALALMEQHLSWDTDDRMGVRFLIGDIYLLCSKRDEARRVFEENADFHPYAYYSLGLLAFLENRLARALTFLRKGFAGNFYVAEGLTGRDTLEGHFYGWAGPTSYCGPEAAKDALEISGYTLWQKHPAALDFLDWAFFCSKSLRERADFIEIQERLKMEHDFDERIALADKRKVRFEEITDRSSMQWLEKFSDHEGQVFWPWQNPRMKRGQRIDKMIASGQMPV